MRDNLKVSIVTPSYNQGRFIEETIRSVLNQTYSNIEYIIIDGGSVDGTRSILKKYESAIDRIVIEPDKGQADAIDKGFRLATGELVGWINADDVLLPRAAELSVECYNSYPRASLFYGDLENIDENGRYVGISKRPRALTFEELLNHRVSPAQPGSFYSTKLVEKVGGICKEFYLVMDLDLWLRLLKQGNGIHVGVPVARFRRHSHAKSSEPPNRYMLECMQIYRKYDISLFSLRTFRLLRTYFLFYFRRMLPTVLRRGR